MSGFLSKAFTLEGDQLYCQHAFRIYSCNQASARFLTSDVENDIRKQQAATDDLNRQVRNLSSLLFYFSRRICVKHCVRSSKRFNQKKL